LNKRPAQRSPRHTTPFLEIRPLPQRCHFRPPPAATFNRRQQEDTKGKRDERIPLHPLVVEHLDRLKGSFDSHVFPWNRPRRALWPAFKAIQESAKLADGSPLPKQGKPNRDGTADWYEFHDLRRGFATLNAAGMDLFQLQALMQHRSLETTRKYVNMANRLNRAVDGLFTPDVARPAQALG